jgi:hypothetical protein
MFSPSNAKPGVAQGMHHGFMSYDGTYPTIGHGGGTQGFNTQFAIVPEERFGVVLLTNASGGIRFNEKALDLLIGNSRDDVPTPSGNLPDASSVAGNYVMLRRHKGNVLEPLNFLLGTNLTVDAIDENTITLNAMGMAITYRQTEPYVFRVISFGPMIGRVAYEIRFIMENGSPAGISTGGPFDATIQTFSQSTAALAGGASIAAMSIIFFLIMPIIVLINFLRRKKNKMPLFGHLSNGLLVSGTLLALNNIVLFVRLAVAGVFLQTSIITPHVWTNYILLALMGILLVASLVFFKRDTIRAAHKALYFSTISLLALFVFILWHWNFFVMM